MSFEERQQQYLNIIYEYQYVFEMTKCCGYVEWVSMFKRGTLNDLYTIVHNQMKTPFDRIPPIRLFLIDASENKIELDRNDDFIYDYILKYPSFFKPIYPIPYRVIYRLYIDDGHCHTDHCDDEEKECIIHNKLIG